MRCVAAAEMRPCLNPPRRRHVPGRDAAGQYELPHAKDAAGDSSMRAWPAMILELAAGPSSFVDKQPRAGGLPFARHGGTRQRQHDRDFLF